MPRRPRPRSPTRSSHGLRPLRRPEGHPRRRARAVRRLRRRVLARAGAGPLPGGVRARADGARLARGADPGGLRRRRARAERGERDPGGDRGQRRQPGRLPRADVRDGNAAAARLRGAEAALAAGDRRRRSAAAGVRGDRADRRFGHDEDPDPRSPHGLRLRGQRPEGLDLARAAQRPDDPARPHHAARRGGEEDRRPLGLPGRHARARRQPRDQPDQDADEPRHHRDLLRRPAAARGRADRRGGQGLPLHPRRHERRAHPDRRRVHRRRALVRREGVGVRRRARQSSAARSAPTRASSSRSPARTWRSRPPT